MGRRLMSGGEAARAAQRGFTLIEVMIAMAITLTVMLANLFLFNTAQKNLAFSKALTNATNLATGKIADFKSKTIDEINAAAPTVLPAPNPLAARQGSDTVTDEYGSRFTRTWVVSEVDVEHDGVPDMVGDVLKVKVDVAFTQAGKGHVVTMTTFTTGKTE